VLAARFSVDIMGLFSLLGIGPASASGIHGELSS
jgi:hypothetical protein